MHICKLTRERNGIGCGRKLIDVKKIIFDESKLNWLKLILVSFSRCQMILSVNGVNICVERDDLLDHQWAMCVFVCALFPVNLIAWHTWNLSHFQLCFPHFNYGSFFAEPKFCIGIQWISNKLEEDYGCLPRIN